MISLSDVLTVIRTAQFRHSNAYVKLSLIDGKQAKSEQHGFAANVLARLAGDLEEEFGEEKED